MIDISSHLFRNRSPVAHAGVLVAGLAIGVGSYVLVVGALGGQGAVSAEGGAAARRAGVAASGVILGGYLAAAFVRGYGGPMVNLAWLIAHIVLAPGIAIRLMGEPVPDSLVVSDVPFTPTFVAEVLLMGAAPLVTYIGGHTLWFRLACTPAERVEWADEYLPSLFRDTLLDPAQFDR